MINQNSNWVDNGKKLWLIKLPRSDSPMGWHDPIVAFSEGDHFWIIDHLGLKHSYFVLKHNGGQPEWAI